MSWSIYNYPEGLPGKFLHRAGQRVHARAQSLPTVTKDLLRTFFHWLPVLKSNPWQGIDTSMKLWQLIMEPHPPAHPPWLGFQQGLQNGGQGRRPHWPSDLSFTWEMWTWGTGLSGPPGLPGLVHAPSSPACSICLLEAGDIPASHGSLVGRSQLLVP